MDEMSDGKKYGLMFLFIFIAAFIIIATLIFPFWNLIREDVYEEAEIMGKWTTWYGTMCNVDTSDNIPKTIDQLSTKRLLTMSWLEGKSILDFKNAKKEVRNTIAKNMFYTWYKPFYEYGIIHGDPHLGNYTIQPNHTVNLFDFGCMRIFEGNFIQGVIDLYYALQSNDDERAVHAYTQWGFVNMTKNKLEVLNKWAEFIYSPLMEDKVQKIQKSDSGVYGAQVAAEVHKELKKLGGIKPPKEFVFMDRAAIGLGSVFMHLKAEVNWHKIFHSLIKNFEIKKMKTRQQKILKLVKL